MSNLSRTDSMRMYSWWWDSHISPKNSKWLQENLTDMDSKVKAMIKLIEEDADSFARRAEMYYKKRPELMKLVEEFYRAYRALAERYDHATGALRQAHRTMAEAFPNQVPLAVMDDSPANETDPHTPEIQFLARSYSEHDDLQKDVSSLPHSHSSPSHLHVIKRNGGAFSEDSDSVISKKGLKQPNDMFGWRAPNSRRFSEGKARKGLNFSEAEAKDKVERYVIELQNLKDSLAKLEADKEAEVKTLKEALAKLEAERESSLCQYNQCLERISNLDNVISQAQENAAELHKKASKAEMEAQAIKTELDRVEAQNLEKISSLENKLLHAEDEARKSNERADKAEKEVENLKKALAKLIEEKESTALKYQQCLEQISSLEREISNLHVEIQTLKGEIENGIEKLKGAEEQCHILERSKQSLNSELEQLVQKMGMQDQELSEKQRELGKLWSCIQEERLRFMEAEKAFQSLQNLHCHSQEELRSMASELQSRAQLLKAMESDNQSLKEENKSLNEVNLSSAVSMKNMQEEIFNLRETKGKLEQEVEFRIDQRNALQQEIYCLKEELNELNKKHLHVLNQVESVGLNVESFGSSVKKLQDENANIKEFYEREKGEKIALLEKLEVMEKLIEQNSLLENSLSDLNAELEGVRERLKALEESYESLLREKSTLISEKDSLISQLSNTTVNVEKLLEENTFLDNSLSDANAELEGLRAKSRSLEDSYRLLDNEKSGLITQKETLVSLLESTQERIRNLEKRCVELEEKYTGLERDKESALSKIEELQLSLDLEKQEQATFTQLSETRLAGMEIQINFLQEEGQRRKMEFEEEFIKSFDGQIEIFILQKCVEDLKEKNFALWSEYQRYLEKSKLSEKLIMEMEREKQERQVEIKSLFDQINKLTTGLYRVLKALESNSTDDACEDEIEQYQMLIDVILGKLEENKQLLLKSQDENLQLVIDMSILVSLIKEMNFEVENLEREKNNQIENLCGKLSDLQGVYHNLQEENFELSEEKRSLENLLIGLEEENHKLVEDNHDTVNEAITMSVLFVVLKTHLAEKSVKLNKLSESIGNLSGANTLLEEKVRVMQGNLDLVETENVRLKELLKKSEDELETARNFCHHLNCEIATRNELLNKKETELSRADEQVNFTLIEKMELCNLVQNLNKEHDKYKVRVGNLRSELQKGSEEIEIWKTGAEKFFSELQISTIYEMLLKQKLYEVLKGSDKVREKSDLANTEIDLLKERLRTLEGENGGMKSHFASLRDSIVSLENCTLLHSKLHDQDYKDALEYSQHAGSSEELGEDQNSMMPVGFTDLQDLQERVKAVEKNFLELEKLAMQENLDAKIKLEAAMRQIEELKLEESLHRGIVQTNEEIKAKTLEAGNGILTKDILLAQTNEEIKAKTSEAGNGILTKDILLDQISDCSSYGIRRRENNEGDDQMLELWETTDQDGSIGLTVGKVPKVEEKNDSQYHLDEASEESKSEYHPSSEILAEKELGVDKLEISRRFKGQEGNKKKILERLESDAQKLTNLQITIQDLKNKVEINENSKKVKGIEYGTVKNQLDEVDEAIMKLFDVNGKLMKKFEDYSSNNSFSSFDGKSSIDFDQSGSVRRRRLSEHARRGSEKIARLQLEVQKIQFQLLKLDGMNQSKGRRMTTERSRSVLLRDYLYGSGVRTTPTLRRKKKAHFCACVEPPTRGD